MPTPCRILLVDSDTGIGGSGRSLLTLVRGLDRSAFEPLIVCPPGSPTYEAAESLGVTCQWPPAYLGAGESVVSQLSWAMWYRLLIAQQRIELVHVNDVAAFRLAGWGASMGRVPSICHVRMAPTSDELAWSFGLSTPSLLVFNSRAMAEHTRSLPGGSWSNLRGVIVLNGVDTSRFVPVSSESAKASLGWPVDVAAVSVVSNLSPLKGQDVLLEAAASVVSRGCGAVAFHVVGRDLTESGSYLKSLRGQADRLGLSDSVFFHGAVENVVPYYQASDVVVCSVRDVSVEPRDHGMPALHVGFPRCVIEAAACGRPLVVTAMPGVEEAVDSGETACIVPPGDAGAMSDALIELLSNPERRQSMGRAARLSAESRFSYVQHSRLMERIYSSVLDTSAKVLAHSPGGREGARMGGYAR